MTLSSVVVSRDRQELSVLECILGLLHIGVDIVSKPEHAWQKLSRSKIDALIVDRDLKGTESLLRCVEENSAHASPCPLLMVGGSGGKHQLESKGAVFIFEKPISVEQAIRTLSAARTLIMGGRLRYHRQVLNLPVSLSHDDKNQLQANLVNLSQGGMGIQLEKPLQLKGKVKIAFELPGYNQPVKTTGEVVWTNQCGNVGIRFVQSECRQQRDLQLWLEQQYFLH
jgi:DNA-binding response OmpR family regulator